VDVSKQSYSHVFLDIRILAVIQEILYAYGKRCFVALSVKSQVEILYSVAQPSPHHHSVQKHPLEYEYIAEACLVKLVDVSTLVPLVLLK
jgi:type II secretory pathway component GspD/PulD (secretin)